MTLTFARPTRHTPGFFVAVTAVLGLLLGLLPAVPAAAYDYPVPAGNRQQVADVFNGINDFRAGKGLKPLRIGADASAVAQEWSAEMIVSGIRHSTSHAEDLRIRKWISAGENIAVTGGSGWDGQRLVDMWINSPGHNANMSDPDDMVIGIGVEFGPSDGMTAMFGTTTFYRYGELPGRTFATAEEYFAHLDTPPVPGAAAVITGSTAWGGTLSATTGLLPAGATLAYQWIYDYNDVPGATGPTLQVSEWLSGKKIRVQVTANAPGYRETVVLSDQTAPISYTSVKNLTAPTITGVLERGRTLTVNPGTWEPGTRLSYKWNGDPAAIGTTYTPAASGTVEVAVTGTTTAGVKPTTVTVSANVQDPLVRNTVKPVVEGDAAVGSQLYANTGTWVPSNTIVSIEWFRDGTAIPGTAGYRHYTAAPADLGRRISFTAYGWRNGYRPLELTSAATAPVGEALPLPMAGSVPEIIGHPQVGETLTAVPGYWENESATLAYQWAADGTNIFGATAAALKLAAAQQGKKITVKVTGSHPGYRTLTMTSNPTAAVAAAPYAPPAVSPFADIATNQLFYKEMSWLASQGISTGWAEGDGTRTYRALQPVNRDAMAAFLYRAAGSPAYTPPAVSPFADIATNQLFYKEMSWLASQGISTGWAEGDGTSTYRALQPVNRDAMAAFMYRFANP